jgi:hypothetical protein
MRTACAIVALSALVAGSVPAGEVTPTAASFLDIDVSIRGAALGGTGMAIPGGLHSSNENPAGLADLRSQRAGILHGAWFDGLSLEWAAYGTDVGEKGAMGVSATFLRSETLDRYDELGNADGEFHVYDAALSAGYAHRLPHGLQAGLSLSAIRQTVDDLSAHGVSADLGLAWNAGPGRVSLLAGNLGPDVSFDGQEAPLPTTFALGAAVPLLTNRLLLSAVANFPRHYHDDVRAGIEIQPLPAMSLRVGYRHVLGEGSDDALTGVTYGAGFALSGVRIDYGYQPFDDLGDTHRMGLTVALGGRSRERQEAEIVAGVWAPSAVPVPEDSRQDALVERPGTKTASATADRTVTREPATVATAPAAGSSEPLHEEEEVTVTPSRAPQHLVVAGTHSDRLGALLQLRTLRKSGLDGGEIRRDDRGRYQVVLRSFGTEEKAATWLSKEGPRLGGQAFRVVTIG